MIRMQELDLFPIRLRKVLDELNVDDKELERALNLPKDAVYNWTHGVTKSYPKYAHAIADYLNVSYLYLIGETGNPNKTPATESDGLSEKHRTLIELFDRLDDAQQAGIIAQLRAIAQFQEGRDAR